MTSSRRLKDPEEDVVVEVGEEVEEDEVEGAEGEVVEEVQEVAQ